MSDTSRRFRSAAIYDGTLRTDIAQVVRLAGDAMRLIRLRRVQE
jgi:hypothetical protein